MYQAKYVLYFGNFKLSETIVTQWIIMAFLIIVAFLLTRNIQKVPTSKKQVFLEWAIGGLRNLVTETTGTAFIKRAPWMISYIGTIFCSLYVRT